MALQAIDKVEMSCIWVCAVSQAIDKPMGPMGHIVCARYNGPKALYTCLAMVHVLHTCPTWPKGQAYLAIGHCVASFLNELAIQPTFQLPSVAYFINPL